MHIDTTGPSTCLLWLWSLEYGIHILDCIPDLAGKGGAWGLFGHVCFLPGADGSASILCQLEPTGPAIKLDIASMKQAPQ